MFLCSSECCVGNPVQRYVAQTSMPKVISEVHLFSDGRVELDYTEAGPFEVTPHVVNVFKSMGSALTWARENEPKLRPDDRILFIDDSAGFHFDLEACEYVSKQF